MSVERVNQPEAGFSPQVLDPRHFFQDLAFMEVPHPPQSGQVRGGEDVGPAG